jgi:SIT family siderophore-iron:H+ symporter-like MFS transporter
MPYPRYVTRYKCLILCSFCYVITGSIIGLIIVKIRRLKLLIIFGTILYLVAFGVLTYVRGSIFTSTSSIIAGQAFLGFSTFIVLQIP